MKVLGMTFLKHFCIYWTVNVKGKDKRVKFKHNFIPTCLNGLP
jgi:hypothetical protein